MVFHRTALSSTVFHFGHYQMLSRNLQNRCTNLQSIPAIVRWHFAAQKCAQSCFVQFWVLDWKNSCVKFAENKSKLVNKKWSLNQKQTFLEKCTKIAVWKNDIIPVEVWQSEVGSLVQKLEVAEAHVEEWKQKYADIEKKKFFSWKYLWKKNLIVPAEKNMTTWKKYKRQLEKDQDSQVRGTGIPKLKSTEAQNKKLKEFKSKVQKVLHFSTFGLELDNLKIKGPRQLQHIHCWDS